MNQGLAKHRYPAGGLCRSTAANVGLNLFSLAANFGVVLILSSLLGPGGYGAFAFATAFAIVLGIPGLLGLPSVVVGEVARERVTGAWDLVHGIIRRSNQAALCASIGVSVCAAIVIELGGWPGGRLREPTLIALGLVPLLAIVSLRQSAMQGIGRVVLARTPDALVTPTLLIGIIAIGHAAGLRLTASSVVIAFVAATIVSASLGVGLLRRTLPRQVWKTAPHYRGRIWARRALPLLISGGFGIVNTQIGTILIGALRGARDAGLFSVATRVAGFVPFFLLAAVPILMPKIAELDERGDREGLQGGLTSMARVVFLMTIPCALTLFAFARPILHLFGPGFTAASLSLRILCVAQLVNVVTGFGGTILIMLRRSDLATWGAAAGAALNVVLCPILISLYGITGAAVASATGLVVANLVIVWLLWSSQGIYAPALEVPSAFGPSVTSK